MLYRSGLQFREKEGWALGLRRSDYENYDYQDFWKDEKRLYEDMSERIALRKMLAPLQDRSGVFADIGCGYGRLFTEYRDFKTILLVDYSMKNLRTAKKNIKKYLGADQMQGSSIHFIAADASRLPFRSDIIDVLLTVRMVHHLSDPRLYFDQVQRVLKDGGTYILEFANKRNTKNILRSMVGRMDTSPFNLTPSRIGDTIQNYHPSYILGMLTERNFNLKWILSVSNFRLPLLKKILPLKTILVLEDIYQRFLSSLSLGPSLFLKTNLEKKSSVQEQGDEIGNILACPKCFKSCLIIHDDRVTCRTCKVDYSIDEGIFDFKQ